MFKNKKEKEILTQIRETFLYWRSENGTQMTVNIIKDIEKNIDSLEVYFPEIDWTKVDKTSIHQKLFDQEKEKTKKSRR